MSDLEHVATVRHLDTGWFRWCWVCTCGRRSSPARTRADAEAAARVHADTDASMGCRCYDPRSMEYDLSCPCAHCRAVEQNLTGETA